MLKPSLEDQVQQKQSRQKSNHDSNRTTAFLKGEQVYARGFGIGPKWVPATIDEVSGPVSYLVRLEDDHVVRRHQDHLRRRSEPPNCESVTTNSESDLMFLLTKLLTRLPIHLSMIMLKHLVALVLVSLLGQTPQAVCTTIPWGTSQSQ